MSCKKEGRQAEKTRKRRLEECGESWVTFPLVLEINVARELDLSLGFGNQFDLGCYNVKCALHKTLHCAASVKSVFVSVCLNQLLISLLTL